MRDEIIEVITAEDAEVPGTVEEISVRGMAEAAEEADPTELYKHQIRELEKRLRAAEDERKARERELECLSLLGDAGLPSELLPAVISSGNMEETVGLLRRTVQSRVDAEVSKRCRTDAPAAGVRVPITKKELAKIPVAELQRMRDNGFML